MAYNPYDQLQEQQEAPPAPKPKRRPWGWGPNGDKEDPITQLVKKVARDYKETAMDLRDEPQELPYRIRERLRSYVIRDR